MSGEVFQIELQLLLEVALKLVLVEDLVEVFQILDLQDGLFLCDGLPVEPEAGFV